MSPGASTRRIKPLSGTKIRAKIVLIGDGGVGKTAFRRTWLGEGFKTEYLMTIGADFAIQEVTYYHSPTKATYDIKFKVWDLAGQPRFKAVRDLYYRGAVGALCFFDVTNQESYRNLVEWIKTYWSRNGIGKSPLLIIGSKCDLRDNPAFPNQVSTHYGKEYAVELSKLLKDKLGFSVHYLETSAKDRINVDEAFKLLAKEIVSYSTFQEIKERKNTPEKY